jgi:hypothetical protein
MSIKYNSTLPADVVIRSDAGIDCEKTGIICNKY